MCCCDNLWSKLKNMQLDQIMSDYYNQENYINNVIFNFDVKIYIIVFCVIYKCFCASHINVTVLLPGLLYLWSGKIHKPMCSNAQYYSQ